MKRNLLALLTFFIVVGTSAQVGEKGKLYLDVGTGIGVYENLYTHKQGNVTYAENEKDTVAASFGLLGLEYGLANWVSLGLNFKSGKYLEDDPNRANTFRVFELSSHFYFLNKDKFTLFGNATIGAGVLNENGTLILWPYEARFSGAHTSVGFGFKWLFLKEKAGLFFNYEYNRYLLDLKKFNWNNQDHSDRTWTYDVKGHELKLGISVKI